MIRRGLAVDKPITSITACTKDYNINGSQSPAFYPKKQRQNVNFSERHAPMANFGKRAQKMRKPAVASRDERCPTTRGTSSGASPGRSCLKTCNNTERMQVQGRALPRREIRCVSYRTGLSQNVITIQDVCRCRGGVAPPAGKYAAFRSGRAALRRPPESTLRFVQDGRRCAAPTGRLCIYIHFETAPRLPQWRAMLAAATEMRVRPEQSRSMSLSFR